MKKRLLAGMIMVIMQISAYPQTSPPSERWLAEIHRNQLIAYLQDCLLATDLYVTKSDGSKVRAPAYSLYVMNPDGSNQKRLSGVEQDAREPAWSPDGAHIAFSVNETIRQSAIWCVDSNGSNLVRLADCNGSGGFPIWSPNGKRIAYEQREGRYDQIHVMDADGRNDRKLTEFDSFCRAWSPDGALLAFDKLQDGKWKVGFMKADGTWQMQLQLGNDTTPSFSNDGKQILFQSETGGRRGICLFDIENSNTKFLTSVDNNFGPMFAPTWDSIVFLSSRNSFLQNHLYIMNTDGSNQRKLSNASPNGNTSFSPDGQFIAFDSRQDGNYEICIIGIDAQDFHQLTKTVPPVSSVQPRWQPASFEGKNLK